MFELLKYNIDLTEDGNQNLRIDFKYLGDSPKTIKVKLINPIFTEIYHVIGGDINIIPNTGWFVSTTLKKPFDIKFNNDCIIQFLDSTSGNVLQEFSIPTFSVDYKRRSLGKNFNKKNIWIFGDSHVDCFFCYGIYHPILQTHSYTINPISNAALTINRFINRDYLKFFSSLPIKNGDEIILMLGEIDCRVALLRTSYLKLIPIESHISNLISRYKISLDKIQTQYPKCKIKICNPLPPLPDNWIQTDKENLLGKWTLKDRIHVRDLFVKELKSQIGDTYPILDITEGLTDKENISNITLLKEDDIHFIPNDMVINNIKNQLNG
jgi:hypothetical protein